MPSAAAALDRLCDPAAKVSAHYLIDEDGSVVQLVPEERRAWHAGVSAWQGRARLNDCSIGIELVNPGHEWGYRPFTEAQYAACMSCVGPFSRAGRSRRAACSRTATSRRRASRIQASCSIGTPRGRRDRAVAAAGCRRAATAADQLQSELARFGYGVAPSGRLDEATRTRGRGPSSATSVPRASTAGPTAATLARLDGLLALL